jgi:asparagine synthase (glutamine-hydrolysing)
MLGNRLRQFRKLLRGRSGDVFERHLAWSQILTPESRGILQPLAKEMLAKHDDTLDRLRSVGQTSADPLNSIMAFDLQYSLAEDMLYKVDAASMSCSLEVRVPLLDSDLAAAVAPLPSWLKVRRGLSKRLFVDAHRDLLPDPLLNRPKRGFEVPIGEYLRGPLRELFRDTVTASNLDRFGLIDYQGVQKLYDDHCQRRGEHADLLFGLLVLCRVCHKTFG